MRRPKAFVTRPAALATTTAIAPDWLVLEGEKSRTEAVCPGMGTPFTCHSKVNGAVPWALAVAATRPPTLA
jgi:hypothetical protein